MQSQTRIDIDLRGFLKSSLLEWEGRICAVVFTAGCNWRCPYCHGKLFVEKSADLEPIPTEAVYAYLEEQEGWIDGVAVTGGEPTLQPGLARFLAGIKDRGMQVKLETNGSRPGVVRELLAAGLLDCICLDFKAPLDDRLPGVSRVSAQVTNTRGVRETFALAAASDLEREYHTTLCPRFIDAAVLEEMARSLEPGGLWILQQYETATERLDAAAAGELRYDEAELERLETIARRHHRRVLLRKGRGGR